MNPILVRARGLFAGVAAAALTACGGGGSDYTAPGSGMGTPGYAATNLVSDVNTSTNPYSSPNVDAHLVNAWGIAFNPNGSISWLISQTLPLLWLATTSRAPRSSCFMPS